MSKIYSKPYSVTANGVGARYFRERDERKVWQYVRTLKNQGHRVTVMKWGVTIYDL